MLSLHAFLSAFLHVCVNAYMLACVRACVHSYVPARIRVRACMRVVSVCYNIENVKEQLQGDAERQSIERVRKHPNLISCVCARADMRRACIHRVCLRLACVYVCIHVCVERACLCSCILACLLLSPCRLLT